MDNSPACFDLMIDPGLDLGFSVLVFTLSHLVSSSAGSVLIIIYLKVIIIIHTHMPDGNNNE